MRRARRRSSGEIGRALGQARCSTLRTPRSESRTSELAAAATGSSSRHRARHGTRAEWRPALPRRRRAQRSRAGSLRAPARRIQRSAPSESAEHQLPKRAAKRTGSSSAAVAASPGRLAAESAATSTRSRREHRRSLPARGPRKPPLAQANLRALQTAASGAGGLRRRPAGMRARAASGGAGRRDFRRVPRDRTVATVQRRIGWMFGVFFLLLRARLRARQLISASYAGGALKKVAPAHQQLSQ